MGCEPDYSVCTMQENPRPRPPEQMRTAAGHVHIGFTKDADPMSVGHFTDCKYISAHFFKDFHGTSRKTYSPQFFTSEETERLDYYGTNGAFRPKTYGIELRQYSNLWVEHPKWRRGMFNYVVNHLSKIDKK